MGGGVFWPLKGGVSPICLCFFWDHPSLYQLPGVWRRPGGLEQGRRILSQCTLGGVGQGPWGACCSRTRLAQGDRARGVPPDAGNLGFVFPVFCPNRGLLIYFLCKSQIRNTIPFIEGSC